MAPQIGSFTASPNPVTAGGDVTPTNDHQRHAERARCRWQLTNLPSGVVLTDATGTTSGNPYYPLSWPPARQLKKGASVSVTLTFTAASLGDITFGTEVVVGL